MAFVLISHLDPNHKSDLTDLIKLYTKMNCIEVNEGMRISPNHIYIIPPNFNLEIKEGVFYLKKPNIIRGLRLPIDFFFKSLALEKKDQAIGIVLSGTGTDGTLGIKEINAIGGLAIVQDPHSANYDGMPKSVIMNAIADYVLPVNTIPEVLIKYVNEKLKYKKKKVDIKDLEFHNDLSEIFTILSTKLNHDFSCYKENTMIRRIERRMVIKHINNIHDYINYLRKNPIEIEVLFKELLIGVTYFFRDKEAYDILRKKVIPELFKDCTQNKTIKIWIPGCSTGEEPYSLAILFQEYLDKNNKSCKIQIFGTDIDEVAIEKARNGIYLDNIVVDVSSDRLNKFFIVEGNNFKIKPIIREKLVFAVQDLITDPPFSNVDLIVCRNLLIYLTPDIQKKILTLFYYSLNSDGYLFLGSSESISNLSQLFIEIDRRWKIYQCKKVAPLLLGISRPFPPLTHYTLRPNKRDDFKSPDIINYKDLMEEFLIKTYTPPSILVNEKGDILYIHGKVNSYLDLPEGEAKMNIFEMSKDNLKIHLASGIRKINKSNKPIIYENLSIRLNGSIIRFNLMISPINQLNSFNGLIMITFIELTPDLIAEEELEVIDIKDTIIDIRVKELEEELLSTKQYLQTTIEELENTNEELQSSNEELQSTNEEIQTSKEELQSLNEELTTVNSELETKITELSEVNSDLSNFISSTDIATLFIDGNSIIQRFSPNIKEILNIIETDIGRPIEHISSNLQYDSLVQDAKEVLKKSITLEKDVQTKDNQWYSMRIIPYRTINNIISGVVITFFNISIRKKIEEEKIETMLFAENIVETTRTPLLVIDNNLKVIKVNSAFCKLFQVDKKETENNFIFELGNKQWDIPKLREILDKIIKTHSKIKDFEVDHNFEKIGQRIMLLNAKELKRKEDSLILISIEDITEKKVANDKLIESREMFKDAYQKVEFYKDIFIHDINNILQIILSSSELIKNILKNPEGYEKIIEMNNMILNQIKNGKNLVKNISLLSQIDQIGGNNYLYQISTLIDKSIENVRNSFPNRKIDFNLDYNNRELKGYINDLLYNAIENIFINSIKHSDKNSIQINIKVSKEEIQNVNYIKIEVEDNGPGIPDDLKNLIFKNKIKFSEVGLGMGLYIVKKIIESINGKIYIKNRVKNDYSKGLNVIILLREEE
ncbi:MAG: PAS domain-containing protein [Candidatus Lokiarchaeota archaeon]|nr:PAS domain-containing protein [Candidatus Lokiarchaeota archaeon]